MSIPEIKIAKILTDAHIKFDTEKTFPDLRKGIFRFDFCVYINNQMVLIEYDGEQHFKLVKKFYKTRQEWDKAREHDRRKNSYCLANYIPLYRIPYWELDNISKFEDLVQEKFKVKTRWHNDNLVNK